MVIQAQQLYSENTDFSLRGTTHQDLLMDQSGNVCGFNFVAQQQQQKPQQQLVQFDQFQNLSRQKMHSFLVNDQQSMRFFQSISALGEKQRMEIDRLISLENERLRLTLQGQRNQQLAFLLKNYESKTQFLLKQKEEEISKASKRTMELEDYLTRLEIENQTWQRVAKQNEAMVASLNSTIERLRESAALSSNGADDAASCCQIGEEEKIENEEQKRMVCKCCNSRNSCMIMIPCRHLSSCKDCEAFLDFCPVCRAVKKASIEALI